VLFLAYQQRLGLCAVARAVAAKPVGLLGATGALVHGEFLYRRRQQATRQVRWQLSHIGRF